MRIRNYDEMEVTAIRRPAEPVKLVRLAAGITMAKDPVDDGKDLIPALVKMGHTSLLEHIHWTFFIRGVSRSALAQLTRHRMASYTAGSQHYQIYSGYGAVVDEPDTEILRPVLEASFEAYNSLVKKGCPHEEARQVLPNAMEVNIIMTVNLRSLLNFLAIRLCGRNVREMRILALKILEIVIADIPSLKGIIGPDCFTGMCRQGKMSCMTPWAKGE